MLKTITPLIRRNILAMAAYSSARSEFSGEASVFLDANENPFGSPADMGLNRYPDPLQRRLKDRLAAERSLSAEQIFLGNGSDEVIDNLIRVFCEPGKDSIMICSPSYGMYTVAAETNDVQVTDIPLTQDFQLDVPAVLAAAETVKIIFICSPNNPSGNVMRREDMLQVLEQTSCIVVVDEAYIDFAQAPSMSSELENYPGLLVMQTFSKARGMAGARLGLGLAHPDMISVMNKVKYPYNINDLTASAAMTALDAASETRQAVEDILEERDTLTAFLNDSALVRQVYPSDANFILARMTEGRKIYEALLKRGIVVRDRGSQTRCENCLRFTVGTSEENSLLMAALREIAGEAL